MTDRQTFGMVAGLCVVGLVTLIGVLVWLNDRDKANVQPDMVANAAPAPTPTYDFNSDRSNPIPGPSTLTEVAPQPLKEDVLLQIESGAASGKPYVFTGSSNLPEGTKLVVSLRRAGPGGLVGQDKVDIGADGRFTSRALGPPGGLEPGDYTADVVVPIPSVHPPSVRAVIGEHGEYMKGALVENSRFGVSVRARKVFNVPAPAGAEFAGTLHDAAGRGNVQAIRQFVKKGVDLNVPNKAGALPLHLAAEWGHVEVVAILLQGVANVNAQNNMGNTALHLAATEGYVGIVELVIAKGATVDALNRDGETPLKCAAATGHHDTVDLLLKNGAKADARDRFGKTALFWAMNASCAELLLGAKADASAKNELGETPMQQAAMDGRKEVVALLLKHRADVNAADKAGNTALKWALRLKHNEVAELLRQHGAME